MGKNLSVPGSRTLTTPSNYIFVKNENVAKVSLPGVDNNLNCFVIELG